jgi:hypothetical protein
VIVTVHAIKKACYKNLCFKLSVLYSYQIPGLLGLFNCRGSESANQRGPIFFYKRYPNRYILGGTMISNQNPGYNSASTKFSTCCMSTLAT